VRFKVDGSLYPDVDPPVTLGSLGDRVDFLARLCSAWDFGILPDEATLREIRRGRWREAVDRCQLLTSPTYHLVRRWHGLSPAPFLGTLPADMAADENLGFV
jgi:hypothetical protein